MRKLLTVLVAGALAVTLGAPAFADDTRGSDDQQVTAMRDRNDRGDRHDGKRGDHDGRRGSRYNHHRHDRDDDHGYRHSRYRRGYGYYDRYPYYYGGYYGYPSYYRDSDSRYRECYDAYYYDRDFYDR